MLPAIHVAQWQTLLAVLEYGSVSAAAQHLHLTQPAVSKRLQALEQALGVTLFDPVGRTLQPTAAARQVAHEAHRWLQELQDLQRELSHAQTTPVGTLSIGTSHHIGLHHLPEVLRTYIAQHPQVTLDVHFVDSEAAHQAVRSGQLELAFLTLPPQPDLTLAYQPLWQDPLTAVCARHHPLAQLAQDTQRVTGDALPLQALLDYPALLPDAHTYTSQLTLAAFAAAGLKPEAHTHTNALDALRMLVSVGAGWSVLPRTLLGADLWALDVSGLQLSRTLGMVWHPDRTLSQAALRLRDHWQSVV